MKLRLQGALAACVRAATTTFCASGAVGPEAPQDVVLELDARTVTEALRLVAPQAPGFEIAFRAGAWRITVDGAPLRSERELDLGLPDRAYVSVAPALAGQGPGIGAVGWWIIGLSAAAAVYAVTQIPEIPDTDHLETGERRTLFSGPVNSAAQGGAVPLIYGKTRVGSTVVSGGITQERPTGGDNASPPDVGVGGERPPGTERPGQDRGRDAEEEREPGPGGAAAAERSVLRVVDLLGEGEIGGLVDGLKSVFIDGVAVEDSSGAKNIEGVSIQERKGLAHAAAGQEALAGFDSTSTGLTHSSTEVKRATPVVGSVPAGYDAARVTLRWPRLVEYDDKGNEIATSVVLQIDSRPSSSGSWTTVLTQTVRDLSLDEQELSWRVERPQGASGTWQIRVSRLTADSTSTRVVDAFYWQRLAGLRDVKQSYPHSAVIGLVIETDRSDVNPTRREYEVYGRWVLAPPASIWDPETPTSTSAATYGSGIWDGTMRRAWTDNQAWIVYDLLTDRRAGLGGIPGMVDAVRAARAGFLELSRRCDALVPAPDSASAKEPRWRFNGSITRREQARKVIDWFLSGCRAGTSWSAGAAALAIDGEFDVSAAIGNANVIDGEFEYQGLRWQERYSAVAVTWQDPDDDHRSGIELVVVDDLVTKYGFRQKDVAAVGCTSRGQAHRVGLLVLNEQENESETAKFRMALEGMHLRPGDRVRIADEQRFEVRAAFRVGDVDTSVSGQETLTLDGDSPRLAAGGTIAWGAGRTAAVSQKSGQSSQAVLVTTDVPTGLSVGDLVVNAAGAVDWIVTEVNERDKVEVEVQARRYDPNKYTAVEQRRQLARPPVNPVADILAPSAVTVRERTYEDRNQVRSLLEISVRGGNDPRIDRLEYQIQRPKRRATAAEIAAGDWSVLPRGPWEPLRVTTARSIVERNVALGGYRLRARFLGGRRRSGWTLSDPGLADGKTDPGAAPTGLRAEGAVGGYWVHWNPSSGPDYAYTEIYDRVGTPGPANADVDVTATGWTRRGTITGSGFRRADVSGTVGLRVAVRDVDTSALPTAAREVGVTPTEPIAGADGEDGVGVEYIFAVTATSARPEAAAGVDPPSSTFPYDQPTAPYTDGLTGLSANTPYGHRWRRPVQGAPSAGDTPNTAWVYDGIVAHWGPEGADGEDGVGVEYIFAVTATSARPEAAAGVDPPSSTFPYDQPTAPYTDGLTGLSANTPYGHRWRRPVQGAHSAGDTPNTAWVYDGIVGRWGLPPGPLPSNVVLSANAASATLTWTNPAKLPGFWCIIFSLDPGESGPSGTPQFVAGTEISFTLSSSALAAIVGRKIYARIHAAERVLTSPAEYSIGGALYAPGTTISGSTQAPNTPGTPTATVNGDDVSVSWGAVTGASTYRLQRRTGATGSWATMVTALAGTSYTDLNRPNGTYYYRVRAQNSGGDSIYSSASNAATVTSSTRPSAPSSPTGLTATVSVDDISVSWGAVTGASTYRLQRRTGATGSWATIATALAGTSYTDLNRPNGTYYYRVRAQNGSGNSSYSIAAGPYTVSTGSAPGTPATFTGSHVSGTTYDFNLAWTQGTGGTPTQYRIQLYGGFGLWGDVSGGTFTGTSTTTSVADPGSTTVLFRIRAENSSGNSGWRQLTISF